MSVCLLADLAAAPTLAPRAAVRRDAGLGVRSYLEGAAGVEADDGDAKRCGWAEAPQRLMITPGGRGQPFDLAAGRFKVGQIKADVLHVMADGYPAGKLAVEYAVRIDALDMTKAEAGDARRLARQAPGERIVIAAATRIAEAVRAYPDQQTVYFAQDKAFLKAVRNRLVRDHGMQERHVAELHGSVDAMRRRHLMQENVRDSRRVFLMTSAGSRGISFPKATTLIILVPRFDIEASLMEVSQVVFRGWGQYAGPDGTRLSGDGFDRRIVFMVEDLVRTEEDGTLDPVRWARQKIDLAGMVLLRATLETRIKGRCAEGFRGAVVPVGQIGLETTAGTMATQVEAFLKECRIAMVEEGTEVSVVARAAQEHATAKLPGRTAPEPATQRHVANPCTKLPETSRQPSTRTKKISLNGSDTALGGSIIMPRLISTLPTTRSMTRNGK